MSEWKFDGKTATKTSRGKIITFSADEMSTLYKLIERFDEEERQRVKHDLDEIGRIVDQGLDKAAKRIEAEGKAKEKANFRIA